jgi:hypothetical protein
VKKEERRGLHQIRGRRGKKRRKNLWDRGRERKMRGNKKMET